VITIALESPSRRSLFLLFVLVVLLPIVITTAALLGTGQSLLRNINLLLAIVFLSNIIFIPIAVLVFRQSFSLGTDSIKIASSFYSLMLRRSEIQIENISAVNCESERKFRPTMRTNGIAIPGYQSGWFVTSAGSKAFVVRRSGSCIRIPTTKGYDLLLGNSNAADAAKYLQYLLRGAD
jgi:Bacterial PH domain